MDPGAERCACVIYVFLDTIAPVATGFVIDIFFMRNNYRDEVSHFLRCGLAGVLKIHTADIIPYFFDASAKLLVIGIDFVSLISGEAIDPVIAERDGIAPVPELRHNHRIWYLLMASVERFKGLVFKFSSGLGHCGKRNR